MTPKRLYGLLSFFSLVVRGLGADIPISALPAATNVLGTDILPIVQGGVTKKAALSLLPSNPGGSSPQAQYNNGGVFAGIPSLLVTTPSLTLSNVVNPLIYFRGTNEGLANLATYSWDVGPSGGIIIREFSPNFATSNTVFTLVGGISQPGLMYGRSWGDFQVVSNMVSTTVTTTNLIVNGPTTTGGSITSSGAITSSGSVTGNGLVSTQTTPGGLLMSYATADAFNFGIVRPSSAIATNQQWILPTTNATGQSFVTVAFTGTNGQLGYTLTNSVGGTGAGNGPFTNSTFYGPQKYITASDSTNVDWSTNSYTKQGITTNTVVTISFINAPPATDSELTFTVNNTAATNIPVLFLTANAITNNALLNGNTTALTSYDVPPGVTQFDWNYNGDKYYFRVIGPPVTFSSYAAGTAWTETTTSTNTAFGTTSPKITFTAGGTYRLRSAVGVKYNGATYTGTPTVNVKLRKTNGTAADVSNATITLELPVLTTFTGGDSIVIPDTDFTVARGDVVEVYSNVSALPSAGSVQIDSGWIVADRKY